MRSQPFHISVPVGPDDHSLGPTDAPVTVIEYGDFQCPICKQAAGAVKLLLARFDQRVRFVYRHFPLEEIHPNALHAAEVAECAAVQGKFWQMHDLLFKNQRQLKLSELYGYARILDLDLERFTKDMNSEVHLPRVHEQQRGGHRSGVRSTPAFFLNGRIVDVSFGLRALFEAVDAELRSHPVEARVMP